MPTTFYDAGPERAAQVNALFRRIAGRYDLVNDLQSVGLHRLWKKRTAQLARVNAGSQALDVCCGTGDIALALSRFGARVVGLDFTAEMLGLAALRNKLSPASGTQPTAVHVHFVRADALMLPFPDNTFDAVTVGYGLRNLADWVAGVKEMQRVIKPGGRLVILEFGKPQNFLWRAVYLAYLKLFVPLLGLLFYGNTRTYGYILESLHHYPSQRAVAEGLRRLGGSTA